MADKLEAHTAPMVKDMPMLEGFSVTPIYVLVRFNKWDDILRLPNASTDMRSVRLLGRLSLAHARRHRARMMLLGAGVMVGVASVTAVLALSRSVIDTFAATLVHGAGAAQLQVSNGTAGLDRDLVDVIARLPGVAATGATVEHHVVLPAANRRITIFGAELGRDEAYREAQIGRDVPDIHDVLTFLACLRWMPELAVLCVLV